MTTPRWPLNGKGNAVIVGAVLIALMTIFGFLGAVPWEPKGSVAGLKKDVVDPLKADIQRELGEIKSELVSIRTLLIQQSRRSPWSDHQ